MKKKQVKCYTYIRVSTFTQADNFSLDAQREKLHKYAEYQDMVIAGEYADEGFSGKNIQGRHVEQLDSVLSSGNRKLLHGAGKVSHAQAITKAKSEYRKYQEKTLSPVEEAYIATIKSLEKEAKKNSKK